MKPIPIYDHRGIMSGDVRDRVFQKHVDGSRHFLRKPPAITLEVVIIDVLKTMNITDIHIIDREKDKHYWSTFGNFLKNSFVYDRGFSPQHALPFSFWTVGGTTKPEIQPVKPIKPDEKAKVVQPSLFDTDK